MSSASACKIVKSPNLYFQLHLLSPLPPRELDIMVICCFYYSTHLLFHVVPKPSAYHNALAFHDQIHPLSSSFPFFPSFYYYLYLHSVSVHHQTMRKANLWLLCWLSLQSLLLVLEIWCVLCFLRLESLCTHIISGIVSALLFLTSLYLLTLFITFFSLTGCLLLLSLSYWYSPVFPHVFVYSWPFFTLWFYAKCICFLRARLEHPWAVLSFQDY